MLILVIIYSFRTRFNLSFSTDLKFLAFNDLVKCHLYPSALKWIKVYYFPLDLFSSKDCYTPVERSLPHKLISHHYKQLYRFFSE